MNIKCFLVFHNPKHTVLFATLFIPGVDKFDHQLYWDKKKCKANIPPTSNLEHILFLHRPWKNFLSTLELSLNFSNFYFWLRHNVQIWLQKCLNQKTRVTILLYFLISNNFYFMKNPSKMPVSILKLKSWFLQFSTQAM